MVHRESLTIDTRGRSTYEITGPIQEVVGRSKINRGLCNVFLKHTSASLIVCENADPTVRRDLEVFAARLVADGDPDFVHDLEGPDDMPAHIRSILTQASISLPVEDGRCELGTWQGLFLCKHRSEALGQTAKAGDLSCSMSACMNLSNQHIRRSLVVRSPRAGYATRTRVTGIANQHATAAPPRLDLLITSVG